MTGIGFRTTGVVITAGLLLACSGSERDPVTVHVFSNRPDHPDVAATLESLDAAGYAHRVEYLDIPGGLELGETAVVYPETAAAHNRAQCVARAVSAAWDQDPVIRRRGYGNHAFTPGNLGLYLFLPGPDTGESLPGVRERLAASCGDWTVELAFLDNRRFRMDLDRWVEAGMRFEPHAWHAGRWRSEGGDYLLASDGGPAWRLRRDPDAGSPVWRADGPPEIAGCGLRRPL